MHGRFGMSTGFKGGPYYGGGPGLSFVAHVTLRDGSGVTFDSRQQPETLNWPYRLLGSFAILLVAVIALSLLAVRWTTRPLKTLAEAAEQLGTNIHSPPLAENGPDEVQRAARAFNTMQAKLIASLRERNQMLAAISHDLKTPITRLKLRAEMLDDDTARSKFAADLDEMEAMVVRTLDFMRGMESSESRQPIDVNALVHSIQSDVQETGGTVEVEGAPQAPYVGQPQALKRCIANLVENALKYGSAAHVRIEDDGERLVVRVADRGPGIPDAALERVFEPFYRLEGSRNRSTGGTGLGLAIARSVAQNHGGTLCLRNLPEGGLEAVLALPRTA
jgi:signal transduction histidine kinase